MIVRSLRSLWMAKSGRSRFARIRCRCCVRSAPDGGPLDPYRFGVEACRPILEIIIDFCHRQKLIERRIAVDELFDDTTRALKLGA